MALSQKDIKNLFLTFYEVLLFCEGLKSCYNTKTIFQRAKTLEDTVTKLQSIEAVEDFQLKLNEFWALKGLSPRRVEYFQSVSCLVLQRFMSDNQFSDDHVSEAINEFLQLKTEIEFLEFLKSQSFVQKSVDRSKQGFSLRDDLIKYKAFICLQELKKLVLDCNGDIERLTSQIKHVIRDKDDTFKTMLQVLNLPCECELETHVQSLVAMVVSSELSNLDTSNHHCQVFELNSDEIDSIIHRWPSILEPLMKMLEFSVKHLQCVYEDTGTSYSWKYVETESGITFDCITSFLSKIRQSLDVRKHFQKLLERLKSDGSTIIVEDILRLSKLK